VKVFRVGFTSGAQGTRVGIERIKVEARLGELMAKDVGAWAGGGQGCEARAVMPPPAPPAEPKKAPPAKKKR
jgi:hypothetical protein